MTTKQGALNLWHGQGAKERHARTRSASIGRLVKIYRRKIDQALETLKPFGIITLLPCDLEEVIARIAADEVDERARKAIAEEHQKRISERAQRNNNEMSEALCADGIHEADGSCCEAGRA
jgi:hypothetical protein